MIQNQNYVLKQLEGKYYLLPIGQMIANLCSPMEINSTGVYIWNLLACNRSLEEITLLCAEHFEASEDELPALTEDVSNFVRSLQTRHMIDDFVPINTIPEIQYKYIKIAGFTCCFSGFLEAISPQFDAFECPKPEQEDIQIVILRDTLPDAGHNSFVLLNHEQLCVIEAVRDYYLSFPTCPQKLDAIVSKDGTHTTFYCTGSVTDELKEHLFHAIRLIFLLFVQKHHMGALHSASILYRGKAWLFSAPSGTGKSTHTNMWKKFLDTPVINGDLNLIAFENDTPVVHGIPWCGTSGIYDTKSYPLGGIILLEQWPANKVLSLPNGERLLAICNRLISPKWTEAQLDYNLDLVNALADKILISKLRCTPDKEAVDTMRKVIDQYLDT